MNWYKKSQQADPNNPVWHFDHPDYDLLTKEEKNKSRLRLPIVYVRFGDAPRDKNGNYTVSLNHFTGEKEDGISVYPAYYDKQRNKYILSNSTTEMISGQNEVGDRNVFVVSGVEVGEGSDGEPVLDPKTFKILKQIDIKDIVSEQDRWSSLDGGEYLDDAIPNYGDSDVLLHKENVPLLSKEERERRKRQRDEEDLARYKKEKEDYDRNRKQLVDAVRLLVEKYPEYRERFLPSFPELKNS